MSTKVLVGLFSNVLKKEMCKKAINVRFYVSELGKNEVGKTTKSPKKKEDIVHPRCNTKHHPPLQKKSAAVQHQISTLSLLVAVWEVYVWLKASKRRESPSAFTNGIPQVTFDHRATGLDSIISGQED